MSYQGTPQGRLDLIESLRQCVELADGWVSAFTCQLDRAIQRGASQRVLTQLDREINSSKEAAASARAHLRAAEETDTHGAYLDRVIAEKL